MKSKYENYLRRLIIYQSLLDNLPIKRSDLCAALSISERTLDRDISSLKTALSEMATFDYALTSYDLEFDSRTQTYKLIKGDDLYDSIDE